MKNRKITATRRYIRPLILSLCGGKSLATLLVLFGKDRQILKVVAGDAKASEM
jgi:hypothetical protein